MAKRLFKKDVQWRIGHPSESFEMLRNAIRRYGVYVYSDPAWDRNSDYAFFISDRKLTQKEVRGYSKLFNKFDEE